MNLLVCSDHRVAEGHCFVETEDHWTVVPLGQSAGRKVIRCSVPGCPHPAVSLDHHYPYESSHNRCSDHPLYLESKALKDSGALDFTLGQRVKIKAKVEAVKRWDYVLHHTVRRLETEPLEATGIVTGVRTRAEGWIDNLGEDGIVFQPTRYRRVVLVALTLYRAVEVLPGDLEAL